MYCNKLAFAPIYWPVHYALLSVSNITSCCFIQAYIMQPNQFYCLNRLNSIRTPSCLAAGLMMRLTQLALIAHPEILINLSWLSPTTSFISKRIVVWVILCMHTRCNSCSACFPAITAFTIPGLVIQSQLSSVSFFSSGFWLTMIKSKPSVHSFEIIKRRICSPRAPRK